MRGQLSILGLFNYQEEVFSGLIVPNGIDRAVLIEYIMMECADLEVLYPNIEIMQILISGWAKVRQHSWERLYQSTVQNYNMIHNYDRYEEWKDTGARDTTGTHNETTSNQGTDTSTSSTNGSGSGSNTNTQTTSKPGYNVSAGMVNTETVQGTGQTSSTEKSSSTVTGTTSSTGNRGGSDSTNEQSTGQHTGHLYGNIGVTTAAQMLNEERELYKWDVYAAIAQEFKERFCVMVY